MTCEHGWAGWEEGLPLAVPRRFLQTAKCKQAIHSGRRVCGSLIYLLPSVWLTAIVLVGTGGLIGSDFRSKQMILVLHIWMIHKRLMVEGKPALLIQEALFDELWEDTSNRIRAQGIGELSVNRYLKDVQGYSFRCCVELDHVLSLPPTAPLVNPSGSEDEKDVVYHSYEERILDELAGALWRGVYLRREDVPEDHVLALAEYVRREQLSLLDLSQQAIFEGRILWGKPPAWKKRSSIQHIEDADGQLHDNQVDAAKSEEQKEKERQRREKILQVIKERGIWREAVAPDGRKYYWNSKTRESRWEKPV